MYGNIDLCFYFFYRDSSLLGVALDDNSVCIIDMDSRNVIRRMPNHQSRLTCLEFSQDARWLLTSTMDCNIRTWDVPSAHLIDIFKYEFSFNPFYVMKMLQTRCNLQDKKTAN